MTSRDTQSLDERTRAKRLARLRKRHRSEALFRGAGVGAILIAMAMLVILLGSVVGQGYRAFEAYSMQLEVPLDEAKIDPNGDRDEADLRLGDYAGVIKAALRSRFPEISGRSDKRALYALVSKGAQYDLQKTIESNPALIGQTIEINAPLAADAASFFKGHIDREGPEVSRRLSDLQIRCLDQLMAAGQIDWGFNLDFLTSGDSREPELAGVGGAIVGSFLTLIITLLMSFPVGVAAALYLEEFAPKRRFTDFLEVNINNLAAVPSIVYGLLGLAVFLGFFGFERSAPLVGGMVLSLMTLPTIIISTRASLLAVPPSLREAAMGIGASPIQVVFHHVLPQALPGILTGTIIGMARALGETAPLLMIGMVAFVADVPKSWSDPSTVLPVQIFLWSDAPERAFAEKTAGAIIVLLGFLLCMNGAAVWLRRRVESRTA